MNLLEYEGKRLLKTEAVAVPKSFTAGESPTFLPAVLKSQILVGGRGKAGGVAVVKSEAEYTATLHTIRNLAIKGHLPKTVLAEELLDIDQELYLSLVMNKESASIEVVAHNNGGVEVESQEGFRNWKIGIGNWEQIGQQLADYYDLPSKTFALQDMVEKLHKLFVGQDMTLLEINPLILTRKGDLVAGDAKIVLDDAAAFRHPDWSFEEEKVETNFVTLNPTGTVATIANGAGLAMATVDTVADAGMQPANFLDIGGGASEASVVDAFKRIMEYSNVRVIIINVFAGITHCDEVAKAIIAARKQLTDLPPLAIRLAGTNFEQAAELLAVEHIPIHTSLDDAIKSAEELL